MGPASEPKLEELARLLESLDCDLFLNHAGPGEPLRFSFRAGGTAITGQGPAIEVLTKILNFAKET